MEKTSKIIDSKIVTWLSTKLCFIAGLTCLIMLFAIGREIIGRFLFNKPSMWSIELSGYLLVALVYLASAYTALVDGHIRVEILYNRFI